jgi:parallel beta-helix repeat protein
MTTVLFLGLLGSTPSWAQRIACTQQAFEDAIQNACPSGDTTITFDCRDTTIPISTSSDRGNRVITCDDVVIDGEDRNITIEQDPPCFEGGTCPDTEGGAWFVSLRGDRGVVRNLAVNYFFEGIHVDSGDDNIVENISFDRHCDDAFTNYHDTRRTIFRNSTVRNACDKAIQLYGSSSISSSVWNATIDNVTFTNCNDPIRMGDTPSQRGRFHIKNVTVNDPSGGLFFCGYNQWDGGAYILMEDSTVEGCKGWNIHGAMEVRLSNNTFRDNVMRGVLVYGTAKVSLDGNTFSDNGGSSSSNDGYGGVAVKGDGQIDLGGGSLEIDGTTVSSPGNNVLYGNRGPGDSTLDVENATSATVRAENNWWGDLDPSDQVSGSVDHNPFLDGPPGGGGGSTPPEDVSNLRRTDRRP